MNKDLPQNKRNVKKYKPPFIIGWREIIGLPDFGVLGMPAKIDTGARTSALHAENQEVFERDGSMWVRFYFPIKSQPRSYRLEAPIIDERMIKNTGGVPELRIVIRTTLMMGSRHWGIDVSLADRKKMGFDLIIGRTALRGKKALVDPSKSYILDQDLPHQR